MSRDCVLWIIAGGISFGLWDISTRIASDKLTSLQGAFFIELGGMLLTLIILLSGKGGGFNNLNLSGIGICLLGGVAVALGGTFYFLAFQKGGELVNATSAIMTTELLLAALAGLLFFEESLTLIKGIGFICCIIGIWLLMR